MTTVCSYHRSVSSSLSSSFIEYYEARIGQFGLARKMDMRGYLLVVLVSFTLSTEAAIVNTDDGAIEGLTTNLTTGKTVDAFLGIPYAMPPLGTLRFASPQPAKPWNGTFQAKVKSAGCIQQGTEKEKQTVWWVSNLTESEDCLYLNVWRPAGSEKKNLTVMVWLHGGGFFSGSANLPLYDGSILATENNVIVVSMNYRLSLFGLLYLGIPEAPGNMDLQDQILVFKWVQRNIASFGGDPNKVTLFGQSAGSIAIGYHLTNPAVRLLFRNGIMESGSSNVPLTIGTPEQAMKVALEVAKQQNCPQSLTDKVQIVNCLQSKNASELIFPYLRFPPDLVFDFLQVTNGIEVCEDVQACLVNLTAEEHKPILIGTTKDEFNWFQTYLFQEIPINNDTVITETMWINLISRIFMLQDERLQKLAMEPYEGFDYDPAQVRVETGDFISDAKMTCPVLSFQNIYFSESANMYAYSFTQRLSKPRVPMPLWVGTEHGDEVPFVFGAPVDPTNKYSTEESLLSKKVMAYWTQFAKTSNPNGNEPERTSWPIFDPENKTYLSLAEDSYPSKNLKESRCFFWHNTYPQLVSLQEDLTKLKSNKTC